MPPLRPFPFPSMNVGTDIVSIPRIHALIKPPHPNTTPNPNPKSRLESFIRRTLTPREIKQFHARYHQQLLNTTLGLPKQPEAEQDLGDEASGTNDVSKTSEILPDDGVSRAAESVRSPMAERREAWSRIATYLAGRWAAKEAVVKACHWRRLTLDQIQILHDDKPSRRIYGVILDHHRSVKIEGKRRSERWEDLLGEEDVEEEGQVVRISISHEKDYATAVCIAASEEGREGDVGGEAAAREPI